MALFLLCPPVVVVQGWVQRGRERLRDREKMPSGFFLLHLHDLIISLKYHFQMPSHWG